MRWQGEGASGQAATGRIAVRPGRPRRAAVEAARHVLAGGGRRAAIGVVLGTGMGGLADRLESSWAMPGTATGWLPRSTATGHAGRLVCGTVRDVSVVMLQGRVHVYEGAAPELLTRGVELLAALGARRLLLTNAAGGLRPDMRAGEIVVLADHLDLVRRPWGDSLEPAGASVAAARRAGPYSAVLRERSLAAARRAGAVARAGVYAYLAGPNYETRAEYRMLRRIGADVVGMSTVPEVVAAGRMGLEVAACSVVTNVARPDAAERTDAEDVCRQAAHATDGIWAILRELAGDAGEPAAADLAA